MVIKDGLDNIKPKVVIDGFDFLKEIITIEEVITETTKVDGLIVIEKEEHFILNHLN